jgi:hypothetical protein
VSVDSMTKTERDELAKLARRREKLAKADVDHRAAILEADFEEQLAKQYDPLDARWRELYDKVEQAIEELNATIADECEQAGIPAKLGPQAYAGWASRGENYSASRRAELRKVAKTRIVAKAKAAKNEIERRSLEVQTELVSGGLLSDDAKVFLDAMPTAETLMLTLDLVEIEAGTKDVRGVPRR